MDLDLTFPALSDMKAACKRRIPYFVWEYVDSATGNETTKHRNREALERLMFLPAALRGPITPDLGTRLLGQDHALPFGVAPVGMSGLMWPGAEIALAEAASEAGMVYCLSNVATRTPEDVGPHVGAQGWFQLYTPKSGDIRRDILRRARAAGFHTLVVTVDLPGPSRRERQLRAKLTLPPRLTPGMLLQIARCPAWALGTLRVGRPRLKMMESYMKAEGPTSSTAHVGYLLRDAPDWDYLARVREEWDGPLVIKGVMEADVATRARREGIDAVWVSNHAGRQFDGAPGSIDVLAGIRAAVGPDYPLIFDGGLETGLDMLRAFALGADYVMLGRGWHYALGAMGPRGAPHLVHVLREDLITNMKQMGITRPGQAASRLWPAPPATAAPGI
ncbi:alpha-hydroxy acid oxidase [Alkalilacustris brevis]|uniref:alpha-hydroxy acid oxidase n=1 Tax=Alkalilacustris brevis TaxID=2026338 RepID=UPI000E0D4B9D|nr:alpha-hydroxy acid oxidase [Alkalilacustris brevis]